MNKALTSKFKATRKLFPIASKKSGIVYLNSASTGPLCKPVKKALDEYYELCQYLTHDDDHDAFADLEKIRRLGAKIIGASKDEVGFGWNTGYGLNLAAQGLPLMAGDEILLSDIEFPSNVYPWLALRERGINIKFIESTDKFFDIGKFKKTITKKSRLLSLSFVQFFNGYKNDLKTIGEICRENNLFFVVDGIQGCGTEPIDVKKWHIDIFSSGAQKWLLAQLGSGIFYIRKDIQERMIHPLASWLAVDWKLNFTRLFNYKLPFFDSARGFEFGTYPYAHVHGLAKSLELITSLGIKNIQNHNHHLLDILIAYLKSNSHFRITSSLEGKHRSSILAFTCNDVEALFRMLRQKRFSCSLREGAVRISAHLFNSESDIKLLINALDGFRP